MRAGCAKLRQASQIFHLAFPAIIPPRGFAALSGVGARADRTEDGESAAIPCTFTRRGEVTFEATP